MRKKGVREKCHGTWLVGGPIIIFKGVGPPWGPARREGVAGAFAFKCAVLEKRRTDRGAERHSTLVSSKVTVVALES